MSIRIDPRYSTAQQWTAQSSITLAPYGTIPILLHEDDWKSWARYVVGLPAVAAVGAVHPDAYDTWQRWARDFNSSLTLLTT